MTLPHLQLQWLPDLGLYMCGISNWRVDISLIITFLFQPKEAKKFHILKMNNTTSNYSDENMTGNRSDNWEDYMRNVMEYHKYYNIMCTFIFGPLIL